MYGFEHGEVPETLAWETQRGQDAMHEYIGGAYVTFRVHPACTAVCFHPDRSDIRPVSSTPLIERAVYRERWRRCLEI